jgi:hypothetical protein
LTVSVVKLTCFAVFEVPLPPGVEGTEGSTLSRLGLLGLLDNVGMAVGIALGFFALEPGYRRMDLTRSNLLGLRKRLFGSDFGALARLFVVADFVKAMGVGFRFGLDGDRDKVGICVAGFVTLAARAKEACVGVLIDERKLDWERGIVGVVGMALFSVETGLSEEVSSSTRFRARLAGAVFSNRSVSSLAYPAFLWVPSLSSNWAFDGDRFRLAVLGVNRPGCALKADGWPAIESIFLNSAM